MCVMLKVCLLCGRTSFLLPVYLLKVRARGLLGSLERARQDTVMAAESWHREPEAPPTWGCSLPLYKKPCWVLSPGPRNAEPRLAPQCERPFRTEVCRPRDESAYLLAATFQEGLHILLMCCLKCSSKCGQHCPSTERQSFHTLLLILCFNLLCSTGACKHISLPWSLLVASPDPFIHH